MLPRWLVVLPLLAGCAGRVGGAESTADRPPSASKIYTVGEEHYAAGRYAEAVTLWRHAVLELPATADFDDLRHKLVLRLGHGQLMAWQQTGNPGFLEDAQQMLERYAERHEQLFGEGEDALAQRGEIFELLFEVEQRLAPPEDEDEAEAEDPMLTLVAIAEEAEAEAELDEEYVEDGEFRRTVVVSRERPSVDDPEVRGLLGSDFTDPFAPGGVLTGPEIVLLHGPRPLLRAGGLARPVGDTVGRGARRQARTLGSSLLTAARPALKSCYEAAFVRQPTAVARSTVEVEIDPQGQIQDATIVDGGLVDTLGDLCLVEHLESTRVERTATAESMTIRVPLTFFYQAPVFFDEATGGSAPAGTILMIDDAPAEPEPGREGSAVRPGTIGA